VQIKIQFFRKIREMIRPQNIWLYSTHVNVLLRVFI